MPKNFSKKSILEFLEFKLQGLIKVYGFDLNTGYAQVEGKGEELNREYGEYYFYKTLISSLDYFLFHSN